MYILGINAYHGDSSACLIKDGEILAAVEEERFNRIKHWSGFPEKSIKFCLDKYGLDINDVSYITTNSNFFSNILLKISFSLNKLINPSFLINQIIRKRKKTNLKNTILKSFHANKLIPKIINIDHHLSHISSSFYCSPFDESISMSIDGFGDFASLVLTKNQNNKIKIISRVLFPNSAGVFYQTLTQYLGFKNYGDEYKVMGMAGYGEEKYTKHLDKIVKLKNNGKFEIDNSYFNLYNKNFEFNWDGGTPTFNDLYNEDKFKQLLNLNPRNKNEDITDDHFSLAASLQSVYEKILFNALDYSQEISSIKNLCLAGGCAMNSLANGKIRKKTKYKNIYIPSAPSDAGGSIGSALNLYFKLHKQKKHFFQNNPYLGCDYSNEFIKNEIKKNTQLNNLNKFNIMNFEYNELINFVTKKIIQGNVIGWFQGRMELGPRALGNRSILCDPRIKNLKDLLNIKIKRRESFRPFAPAILKEYMGDWFDDTFDSPFMMQVTPIKKEKLNLVPAIVHVDGTCRVQTVDYKNNNIFYDLLKEFHKLTSVPILLNTSFNENEPIVNEPKEAINCFLRTKLDILVLNNYIIMRK